MTRPRLEVADVFRQHGDVFLQRYGRTLSSGQRRVLRDVAACRTATLGGHVTDLLTQGVPLEDVQYLAGHTEPRTTGLYDRRQKKVTRNIVERISI